MCLDVFHCAIFMFWYFDITFLTILSWTISIHIWAESNFFDTYRKNRFWSPILILLVFQSYHCAHPVSIRDPSQPLDLCFAFKDWILSFHWRYQLIISRWPLLILVRFANDLNLDSWTPERYSSRNFCLKLVLYFSYWLIIS